VLSFAKTRQSRRIDVMPSAAKEWCDFAPAPSTVTSPVDQQKSCHAKVGQFVRLIACLLNELKPDPNASLSLNDVSEFGNPRNFDTGSFLHQFSLRASAFRRVL